MDKNEVVLNYGDQTTCTINLQGATVTSWKIRNKEQLFVNRQAPSHEFSHIKGGIQLLFPHFGTWSFGPKHGFARTLHWFLEEEPKKLETGEVRAIFSLSDDSYTQALWGYKFKLRYIVLLGKDKLTFKIYLENINRAVAFDFHLMQNSFFRVPDVTKCEVTGLRSLFCKKETLNVEQPEDAMTFSAYVNKMYSNISGEVTVKDVMDGKTVKIKSKQGTDFNLWSPGTQQPLAIEEISGNEDSKGIFCVKSGLLSKPFRLEPLSSWETTYSFEIIEPKKEKKFLEECYDFFRGFC